MFERTEAGERLQLKRGSAGTGHGICPGECVGDIDLIRMRGTGDALIAEPCIEVDEVMKHAYRPLAVRARQADIVFEVILARLEHKIAPAQIAKDRAKRHA